MNTIHHYANINRKKGDSNDTKGKSKGKDKGTTVTEI